MHPNDVELVRVYTREPGGTISDETIPWVDPAVDPAGTTVDIAVECEAGAAVFGLNAPYSLVVYVRDLLENHEIDWHNDPDRPGGDPAYNGHLKTPGENWETQAVEHLITAQTTAFQKGRCLNVLAVLRVGTDIVSFGESPMFIIE